MASPLWKYPEEWEGRLAPDNSTAQGDTSGYYYYYSAYAYAAEGAHVFCLGEDRVNFQDWKIVHDDEITVEQAFTVSAAHRLILFSCHMRVPDMPEPRTLISNGTVDFVQNSGLIASGDGCSGIRFPNSGEILSPLTENDREQWLRISGATDADNNGDHPISGVPWDQGGVSGGDRAIVENQNRIPLADPDKATMVERLGDTGVTVEVGGARWVARAYADWGAGYTEQLQLQEKYLHTAYRTLAFHVSQYTGALSVKFGYRLEAVYS